MIRLLNLALFACLCVTAVSIYQLKSRHIEAERKLYALNTEYAQIKNDIQIFEAEFAYLTEPSRIERLAKEHLDLVPQRGRQIASASSIPPRSAVAGYGGAATGGPVFEPTSEATGVDAIEVPVPREKPVKLVLVR